MLLTGTTIEVGDSATETVVNITSSSVVVAVTSIVDIAELISTRVVDGV